LNSVRISLLTLGTPLPVQTDTSKTLVVTYYFTITDPQATSNLSWIQTDIAPEFLQPIYQVGNWPNLNESLSNVTSVFGNQTIRKEFKLFQNYPNPFNPGTNIKYSVPENGFIKLAVYNLIGEEVNVLVNGQVNAGFYEIEFDAALLLSGIYFYQLRASSFVETKKMVLMK